MNIFHLLDTLPIILNVRKHIAAYAMLEVTKLSYIRVHARCARAFVANTNGVWSTDHDVTVYSDGNAHGKRLTNISITHA